MFVFADEIANYPNPSKVDPLLMPFTPLEQNPDAHLNTFLEKLFNKPDVIDAERNWNGRWGNDALKSMLNLKSNFQPTGQYYSASDARRFLYEGVPQYVLAQNPAWMKKRIIDMNQALDINAFPSVKTAFYTVFYRFYAEQRKPERQDVFDILISSIAPYLDMVIVENFQAEIFRKVKRKDAMFKKMEIATLKDFR